MIHTIFIDGRNYSNEYEVHEYIKKTLGLPDYYGHNADALWDCLSFPDYVSESTFPEETCSYNLVVINYGNNEVSETISICAEILARINKYNGGDFYEYLSSQE